MSRRLVHFTHGNPERRAYKYKVCDGDLLFTDRWWTVFIDEVTCEKCLDKLRQVGEEARRQRRSLDLARRKAAKR